MPRSPAFRPDRRALLAGLGLALPARVLAQPSGDLRAIREGGLIRIGVFLQLPPWGGYGDLGAPDGAEVALARLLAADLGVRLRLVPLRAEDRVPALLSGRVDALVAALPITPMTLQRVAFAASHGAVTVALAAREGENIRRIEDLLGKRIAVPVGTIASETVLERFGGGAEVVMFADTAAGLDALFAGQVDAAMTYDWELRNILLTQPGGELVRAADLITWRHAIAVRQGEHDLLRFINTFLFLRSADGSLGEIHQHYFSAPLPSPVLFR
jgi:polar amino acid transport system substrate-binding protein